jgi:hypothetical protein
MELGDNMDVVVLMNDGEFGGIISRTYEEALAHADLIHESMIKIKKKDQEHNEGFWMWIFYDNYNYIIGKKER